jgi:hypothetical protein
MGSGEEAPRNIHQNPSYYQDRAALYLIHFRLPIIFSLLVYRKNQVIVSLTLVLRLRSLA